MGAPSLPGGPCQPPPPLLDFLLAGLAPLLVLALVAGAPVLCTETRAAVACAVPAVTVLGAVATAAGEEGREGEAAGGGGVRSSSAARISALYSQLGVVMTARPGRRPPKMQGPKRLGGGTDGRRGWER